MSVWRHGSRTSKQPVAPLLAGALTPAAVQTAHGDLEALAFGAQEVCARDAAVFAARRRGGGAMGDTHTGRDCSRKRATRRSPGPSRTTHKKTEQVGCVFHPSFRSCFPKLSPGVPFSTRTHEMPEGPGPPVRTMTA